MKFWSSQRYENINSLLRTPVHIDVMEILQPMFRRSAVAWIRDIVAPRPLGLVVDLGCGIGDWSLDYLGFAERVVGIDINTAFIERARMLARGRERGDRAEFRAQSMSKVDGNCDADLVCFGSSAQYLSGPDLDSLVRRINRGQRPGTHVYLRTTVVNPGRRPYETTTGFYRQRDWYENLFRRQGYIVQAAAWSSTLVVTRLVRTLLGIPWDGVSRALAALITIPLRSWSVLRRRCDYFNWIFRKREE